ncbi:hypothetical protein GCM10010517_05180 [Streptosporangium fragile]|uniref:YhfC family intramembrane metalloprotease n=1 Tax=Streptosporangium fragile TaxID=46186 RepID=A0ABP6I6G3_9ACTN
MTATRTLRRAVLWTVPAVAAVAVLFAAALALWLAAPRWGAIALGAGGWLAALVLRGPIIAAVAKLPRERAATVIGAASGPCEEIVRLLLVLLLVSGFPETLWAGYGWAAIEIVYTMVNALAIRSLLGRTDEKSLEARRMLEAQGVLRADGPLWAAVERTGAGMLHIGLTLLLAWQPWLVLVTIPLHSAANLLAVRLMRTSLALTEVLVAAVGAAAFALGLACW